LKEFSINIIGLSKKAHIFDFKLADSFFEKYGKEVISGGDFDVRIVLDKRETFIEIDFKISGKAHLVCDRSLEPFNFPIEETRKIVFKYGDEAKEVSDEIVIITHDQDNIDIGQFVYEFVSLAIPIKKIHPKFQDEPDNEDEQGVQIIYSTSDDKEVKENIDPRWEILKKLK
jgi:uncharacterized protein